MRLIQRCYRPGFCGHPLCKHGECTLRLLTENSRAGCECAQALAMLCMQIMTQTLFRHSRSLRSLPAIDRDQWMCMLQSLSARFCIDLTFQSFAPALLTSRTPTRCTALPSCGRRRPCFNFSRWRAFAHSPCCRRAAFTNRWCCSERACSPVTPNEGCCNASNLCDLQSRTSWILNCRAAWGTSSVGDDND